MTTPPVQQSSTETFGLPPECAHLIAKLRALKLNDPHTFETIRGTGKEMT